MVHKVIIPKSREVNLSIIVPQSYVGEEIEIIAFIKQESLSGHHEILSPALKWNPLANKDFLKWIENAEAGKVTPLETSRKKWLKKRSQLERNTIPADYRRFNIN